MMMPTYYSTLFESFKALLNEEDTLTLEQGIKHIENMCSDDFNRLKLHEIELRMYNNMDLLSGFITNGKMVTQMEINEKLEEIKSWLTSRLYLYMKSIRFTMQPIQQR